MTNLRSLIESARAELPAQSFARWASFFFSASVLTFLISLAISEVFLVLAAAVYAVHLIYTKTTPDFPAVKLPLALFCLLTTLSIFWAENPTVGWFAVRKLILFLILLLTINLVTSARHLKILYQALFIESALAGIVASAQFAEHYRTEQALHPGHVYAYMTNGRPTGFMGHWMNFGGQQMLVFISMVAYLLLALRVRKIWWLAGAVVATSIILNFTRGVWLGCFIACVYLVARWRPRGLWVLPVLVIAGYFISPGLIRRRLESVRHPSTDPSLALRFEMWRVGWGMIQKHPLVGVGPNNIPETYTLYLPRGEIPEVGYREHLHNDFIQLAAERGLPCLAAWVWLMAAFGWHALRVRAELIRSPFASRQLWLVDAAFACLLAFVAEGCFEFNFGTSPVLMVFLFVASTPFVVEMQPRNQERGATSQNKSLTTDPTS